MLNSHVNRDGKPVHIEIGDDEEPGQTPSTATQTDHLTHSQYLSEPPASIPGTPPQTCAHGSDNNTTSTSINELDSVTSLQSVDSSGREADQTKPRWWKRPIIMVPLVLLSIILIIFAVLMGILYPRDPTVTASNLHISELSISYTSNPILVNATVMLDVAVYNPNYYGSHYDDSQIAYSSPNHPGIEGIIIIPGDYIAERSHITHSLSTNLTNVVIDLQSIYQWQDSGLTVNADGDTRGYVEVLGLRVNYAMQTKCQAKFTLDIGSFTASVLEQNCQSSR